MMSNQSQNRNTVHVSNDKQYLETKIVRRYAVSDLSRLVTFREKCYVCSIDYRLCEFGPCQKNWPAGVFS